MAMERSQMKTTMATDMVAAGAISGHAWQPSEVNL